VLELIDPCLPFNDQKVSTQREVHSMIINFKQSIRFVVAVVAIASLASVMASPAAAQQDPISPGTFLGAVLISDDAPAASAFYRNLFGWEMEQAEDGGYAVRHRGQMIAGIAPLKEPSEEVEESVWLVGLMVEDIDDALRAASGRDAKIYEEAQRVSDYGRFAVIADPEDAPVLLIEPGKKPLGQGRDHGSFVWAELWTDDVEAAAAFYGDVIGVEHATTDRGGHEYHILTSNEKPRAGIIKIPPELERVEPGWAPYVAVTDLSATLVQVKELGGRVVFGETEHPADASVALIIDPSGAAMFLYQIGSSGGAQ
jgi:predicted enzyme related to lactoylglutathione lyase